ncbi:MAG: hypothetical protein ACXAAH_15400 [Promethearchaeota archaeon]|jgi:hypothetical protein
MTIEDHFLKMDELILDGRTIVRHDQPKKLRCGFTVEETGEVFQYRISQFKVRVDSRKIFPIESYKTDEVKNLVTRLNDIIINTLSSTDRLAISYPRMRNKIEKNNDGERKQ